MSESVQPSNRLDQLPGIDDPPALRALLLAAGNDPDVRAQISRAYYGIMEGSRFSPSVLHGILLSAIYASIMAELRSAPSHNGGAQTAGRLNGSNSPKMALQLGAITTLLEQQALGIKALAARDGVASKQDLQALQQLISQLVQATQKSDQAREQQVPALRTVIEDLKFASGAINKKLSAAGQAPREAPWMIWCKRGAIAAAVFISGYLICWGNLHNDFDARLDRVVLAQSPPGSVPFLAEHGGSIFIAPIKDQDGNEHQAVVIKPGTLGKPFISTTGNVVIPIP